MGETGKQMCRAEHPDSGLRTLDSSAGFTLLEVMVALSVLAIGIVTVLELFAGSLRLGSKASRHTQATIYAQNVMDRLFAQSTLTDGEEGGEMPGGYYWRARVQEIQPDEDRTRLQPERQNPTDLFHLKEIEVRVSWEGDGGQQVLTLRTLRTLTEQQTP
jgi:general secretion pathway protein I